MTDTALMTAYEKYTPGSLGFVIFVETHFGAELSRSEIARIAERAATPEEFERIWESEDWWCDDRQ